MFIHVMQWNEDLYDYVLTGEPLKYVDENCDWYLIFLFKEELPASPGTPPPTKLAGKKIVYEKKMHEWVYWNLNSRLNLGPIKENNMKYVKLALKHFFFTIINRGI